MTDREMLEDCLKAFEAMETARASRRLMTRWGFTIGLYEGKGQDRLATLMRRRLNTHLHGPKED